MVKEKGAQTSLSSALAEAQNILDAAEKRAEKLIADAESVREEAAKQGFEEGLARGKNDAAAAAIRLMEESSELSERLAAEAAKLAIAISSSVIGEHVRTNPDTVLTAARRALQESVVGDSAIVLVHPDDRTALEESIKDLQQIVGDAEIEIQGDRSLSAGGCVVKTEFGEVDASVESLLSAIAERLGIKRNGR